MADLGTIGQIGNGLDVRSGGAVDPVYFAGQCGPVVNTFTDRVIPGIGQVAGIAAPGHKVMLIDRNTRQIIRTQTCGPNGEFCFEGLVDDSETYCAMIMDEGDIGSYNATVLDRLTAIAP